MSIFDDIRKDREAGTEDCSAIVMAKPIQDFSWDEIDADKRRIARVPRLERIALAAEELAETHKAMLRMMDDALKGTGKGDMSISPDHSLTLVEAWKRSAAFRAACGEGE